MPPANSVPVKPPAAATPPPQPPQPAATVPDEQSAPPPRVETPLAKPAPPDPPLVAVLRAYLNNRPDEGLALLKSFDKPNQDVLMCLVPLIARLSEVSLSRANPEDMARMVDHLESALRPLRSFAALEVDHPCFCRQVSAVEYKALGSKHVFRPGELVMLFLAPRNFSCTPVRPPAGAAEGLPGAPWYRAEWACTLEVQTADGRPTAVPREEFTPPPSCKPPQHYYEILRFNLPQLPPGNYRLAVEVRDRPTTRWIRKSIAFAVADANDDALHSAR